MRASVYKDKVRAILGKDHLLSLADIQKKLGGADFSTVFRNVEQLVGAGLVKKVVVSKEVVLYEAVEKPSHDHFVCTGCGAVESVHLLKKITLKGKAITDILIRGTCGKCAK